MREPVGVLTIGGVIFLVSVFFMVFAYETSLKFFFECILGGACNIVFENILSGVTIASSFAIISIITAYVMYGTLTRRGGD